MKNILYGLMAGIVMGVILGMVLSLPSGNLGSTDINRFSSATNSSVAVTSTSRAVLSGGGGGRQYAKITNDSDYVVYLALGSTATVNSGIRLNASGGTYEIDSNNLYVGTISAISTTSTTSTLTTVEK